MSTFHIKLTLHIVAACCLSAAPATIALADAPVANMPFLIVGGLLGSLGAGAVAAKAYLSKASSEEKPNS